MVEQWGEPGVATRFGTVADANHFTAIAPLADPDSEMVARLKQLAGREIYCVKTLMVRRRERAVSNHEVPLSASSFETRARALPRIRVEAGSLQWDRFLVCKDIIHAYAVIRYARESQIAFVYLLASHSRILTHCISPSCPAGLPTASRTGDRQDDMFTTNYFRRASPCPRS
jgi:hypothetical protein